VSSDSNLLDTLILLVKEFFAAVFALPMFILKLVVGIASSISEDPATFMLAASAVIGVVTIGLWVLCPIFALYTAVRVSSEGFGSSAEQTNFLARCVRDKTELQVYTRSLDDA
jgi:hypothetical protein